MDAVFQQFLILGNFNAIVEQNVYIQIVQLCKRLIVAGAKFSYEFTGPNFKMVACHLLVEVSF